MDDLNGRYIYIHISLRFVRFDHKMYSRNTQPIYEVEHTVWPDLYAFCPTTNPDFFILYPSDVLFDAPISQWGVGSQGTSIFPATSVALSGSFWEPCRGAAEDPSPKVKDFDRQMCLFFFSLVRNWSVSYAKASSITRASGCLLSLRNSKRSGQLVTSTSFSWCSRLCKMIEKAARAAVTTVPTGRQ